MLSSNLRGLTLISIIIVLLVILAGIGLFLLYQYQEKLIFFPEKLPSNFEFIFEGEFEERNFKTGKITVINALHFKAEKSKGLVLYFHGNAGSLNSWGERAKHFTDDGYDILMIDYRGYGKSSGTIRTESALHKDARNIYQEMAKEYPEKKIIIYGTSLGSGIVAKLATKTNPKLLILETPYYNFTDIVKVHYPYVPTSLILRYKFKTDKFLQEVRCPVFIFHGTEDELIPYNSSKRLEKLGKHIQLITIEKGKHNNLVEFGKYQRQLDNILNA